MNNQNKSGLSVFKSVFLNDKIVLALISLNAMIIFFEGFNGSDHLLAYIDDILSTFFLVEMIVKANHYGIREYLKSGWNKFDTILIILSLPSIVAHLIPNVDQIVNINYLLVFRVLRVFKFFRFIQFFPQVEHIFRSAQSALSASFMVLVGFFVVIFIIAILCTFFFQEVSPNLFGNPLTSYYSIFQVFTVEGWNAIPDSLIKEAAENKHIFNSFEILLIRLFFITMFIIGGIFGLSIVNSIFVDAMISDHDETEEQFEDVEKKLTEMNAKIDKLISIVEKNGLSDQLKDTDDKQS